jgi:hypothetical protein
MTFIVEAILKILAYGFIMNGKDSYLRSFGNILDFLIVIVSIVDFIYSGQQSRNLSKLKVLRVLRVMRPLRIISRSQGLKVAFLAVANSGL